MQLLKGQVAEEAQEVAWFKEWALIHRWLTSTKIGSNIKL